MRVFHSITAFPVLARILSELKLLSNPVGLTVLAAGVGNDIVGWIVSLQRLPKGSHTY